jgi:hypothetical protein
MSNLDRAITDLATRFALDLLAALRSASLEDLAMQTGKAPRGRMTRAEARAAMSAGASRPRHRRSPDEIEKLADRIVAIVRSHRNGISAEELKTILKLARGRKSQKIIAKPLAEALHSKRVKKTGTRRATRYFPAR